MSKHARQRNQSIWLVSGSVVANRLRQGYAGHEGYAGQAEKMILAFVNAGEIAIPEIQRPFVWGATKVRDYYFSL